MQGEKLVLIENEFGEISIDGGFLKDAGDPDLRNVLRAASAAPWWATSARPCGR